MRLITMYAVSDRGDWTECLIDPTKIVEVHTNEGQDGGRPYLVLTFVGSNQQHTYWAVDGKGERDSTPGDARSLLRHFREYVAASTRGGHER